MFPSWWRRWLNRQFRARGARTRAARPRRARRPHFDTLEERVVPASVFWLGTAGGNWNSDSWAASAVGPAVTGLRPHNGDTLSFDNTLANFNNVAVSFAPSNDLTGLTNLTLQISNTSLLHDFSLTGNGIDLAAGGITSSDVSGTGVTVGMPLTLNAGASSVTFTTTLGTLNVTATVAGGAATELQKLGAGTLTLSNPANTYTGVTEVDAGVLSVSKLADGGLPSGIGAATNAAANLVLNGGTLLDTGSADSTNRLFTLGAAGGTLQASGASAITFSNSGSIALGGNGSHTLTLIGTSTAGPDVLTPVLADGTAAASSLVARGSTGWALTGANTYSGTTTVADGGLLLVGLGGTSGTLGTGGVIDNGELIFERTDSLNVPNLISGAGNVTQLGSGTTTLGSNNTYTGTTTISGGVLSVPNLANGLSPSSTGQSTNAAANLVLDGGTLRYTGGAASTDRLFTLSTNGGTLEAAGTDVITFSNTGPIALAGNGTHTLTLLGTSPVGPNVLAPALADGTAASALVKSGPAAWALTGANTYTGTTTITAGDLWVGHGGTAGTLGSGNVVDNGNLVFTRTDTQNVPNVISGSGGVERAGVGTTALGTSNTYTGGTHIVFGVLSVSKLADGGTASSIGASTGDAVNLRLDGGTLQYTGSGDSTNRLIRLDTDGGTLDASGTGALAFTNPGAIAHNPDAAGHTLTLTGTSSAPNVLVPTLGDGQAPASLTKTGPGSWVLTGANTYTGATEIDAGVLSVSKLANGGLPSGIGASTNDSTNLFLNGGTLRYTGAGDSTDRFFTLGSAGGTLDASGTGALAFTNNSASLTLFGAGARTLTLTGTNANVNVLGPFLINFGPGGPGSLTKTGPGTWALAGASTYSGTTTIAAGTLQVGTGGTSGKLGTGPVADNATLVFDRGDNITVANAIGGTGSLTQAGGGTTALTNANTYGGATAVTAGTLADGVDNAVPATTALTVAGGATMDLNGHQQAVAAVGGTGTVADTAGAATFSVNNSAADTFPGSLTGANLTLTAAGNGTLTLTGTNSYGTTMINPTATLQIGAGSTAGTLGTGNVTDNGSLALDRSDSITLTNAIAGGGSLSQNGPGQVTLAAAETYTGPTTVNAGTLLVNGSSASASAVTVNGGTLGGNGSVGGTVQVNSGGTVTPGNTPGILSTGSVTFTPGSTLSEEIDGPSLVPVPQYSQLNVTGTAALGGATLTGTRLPSFVPVVSTAFTIVHTTAGVSGQFSSGATAVVGGITFGVTYGANGGKDVVLTAQVPLITYVDASWLNTALGSDPVGDPIGNLVFGYSAFSDVQTAIEKVAPGGTVVVYAGTYSTPATLNIDQPLNAIDVAVNPSVAAGGTVVLNEAVTLSRNITFDATGVGTGSTPAGLTFGSTVDAAAAGSNSLAVNGPVTFNGAVGAVKALKVLGVGQATLNGGTVITTTTQSYAGPVTLGNDITLNAVLVSFLSTVDATAAGAQGLTVTAKASFGDAVGQVHALKALAVGDTTSLGAPQVVTTGGQTYSGAVTLTVHDHNLTGSRVSFGSTVDDETVGTQGLTITGDASFGAPVGAGQALKFLSVGGATSLAAGSVITTTTQAYGTSTTLGTDATLTGTLVFFGGTLDATAAGGQGLTVTRNASFGGAVGSGKALKALAVSGTTALGAGTVTTTGSQTFTGAVTLTTDDTLTYGSFSFGSTVDAATTGGQGLTLSGDAALSAPVGGAQALKFLTVHGATSLGGGSVATTAAQTYTGAVTLTRDTTLTGSVVSFVSTLNGAQSLAITGGASFGGAVGRAQALKSLAVSGAATLNGGSVTTASTQAYGGAVTLGQDATLTGSQVSFGSTVDATSAGNQGLAITAGASFAGAVGGGQALKALSVSGATALGAGSVVTTTTQTYSGAVTLTADAALTGSLVSFGSTVDAAATGGPGLTITGNATFSAPVGSAHALRQLAVSGSTALGAGPVTTTATQAYGTATTLGKDTTLTGSLVSFAGTLDATAVGAQGLTVTGGASFGGAVGGAQALKALSVSGATSLGAGQVITTTTQTYTGPLTLTADDTLTYSLLTLGSTVDAATAGGQGLTLNGNAAFPAAVGQAQPLKSLAVHGTAVLNGGSVSTTGTQSYGGAVTVGRDTTLAASLVTFASTADAAAAGAEALAVIGNASFGGAVGKAQALKFLAVSGAAALNGGSVTTAAAGAGSQSYGGAVTLGQDAALAAAAGAGAPALVTFGGAVDAAAAGAEALAVTGNASFGGAVGSGHALKSLAVSGTTALGAGTVVTTTTQTYSGAVTLAADDSLGASQVSFLGTVDALARGAQGLTVGADASFAAAVGQAQALKALAVSGATALNAGSVTTTGTQAYTGAVRLGKDTTLAGSQATFGGAVDAAAAGAEGLTVTGDASFNGVVGGGQALKSLAVSGATALAAGQVITNASGAGTQTYTGAVTLAHDAILSAAAGSGTPALVAFGGSADAAAAGGQSLTVSGNASFGGPVGTAEALRSLSVSGATALGAGSVVTTTTQTYSGAVTLTTDAALTGSTVSFPGTVDAAATGGQGLTITGSAAFGAPVGSVRALKQLSVSGSTALGAGTVTTTATQAYGAATTLGKDTALIGSRVSFAGSLDATAAGAQGLTVTGNASFGGAVGGGQALKALSVSGATALGAGQVVTVGVQQYQGSITLTADDTLTYGSLLIGSTVDAATAGGQGLALNGNAAFPAPVGAARALKSLSVHGATTLAGGSVTTTAGQSYAGAVTLTRDAALSASLVTFGSTVDAASAGAEGLTVTGGASFAGAVGKAQALKALAVSGAAALNGGSVTTAAAGAGSQSYGGAVTLGQDAALTASAGAGAAAPVTFGSAVDAAAAGAEALTVTGNASFAGGVGSGQALKSLAVSGTSSLAGGAVTTTTTQTYSGAATLGQDTTLAGTLMTFGNTLDAAVAGAQGLILTGNATFAGAVGSLRALKGLAVSGSTALNGVSVTTTTSQTYTGAVTLGKDTTLTGTLVSFGSTLDATAAGAQGLTVSGNASFGGAVGGGQALRALVAIGTTALNGGAVSTTTTQNYTGAVTLGSDTRLTGSLVIFGGTVDATAAGAQGLTVTGNASFGGPVGAAHPLKLLAVSGITALGAGSVSTTGAQTYTGAVTLTTDDALAGSLITFGGAVDAAGAGAEGLTATGDASFNGPVGAAKALKALAVSGATGLNAARSPRPPPSPTPGPLRSARTRGSPAPSSASAARWTGRPPGRKG
jgi:autotransporter-associated beta strand protein